MVFGHPEPAAARAAAWLQIGGYGAPVRPEARSRSVITQESSAVAPGVPRGTDPAAGTVAMNFAAEIVDVAATVVYPVREPAGFTGNFRR